MINLTKVAAVNQQASDKPLGRLVWYTVPDKTQVSQQQIKALFARYNIPEQWLPKRIRPSDAFRRATAELQLKDILLDASRKANLLVREVSADRTSIFRHLIWEVVDTKGKRLSYVHVGTLSLDKNTNTITAVVEQQNNPPQQAYNAVQAAEQIYSYCLEHYDGNAVRKMVTNIVTRELLGEAVRPSGAVYFVPESRAKVLENLDLLLTEELEAEFFFVPLYDTEKARNMLVYHFRENTQAMIRRLSELLKQPKVVKSKLLAALDDTKHFTRQAKEYEELLKTSLADLQEQVNLISLQAQSLLDKVADNGYDDGDGDESNTAETK